MRPRRLPDWQRTVPHDRIIRCAVSRSRRASSRGSHLDGWALHAVPSDLHRIHVIRMEDDGQKSPDQRINKKITLQSCARPLTTLRTSSFFP